MNLGIMKKKKFGIRIENLVYVKKDKNAIRFKNLTLAPIDTDLINFKMLNPDEKKISILLSQRYLC